MDTFNITQQYIKIRKLAGKTYIEVWDIYEPYLRFQVQYDHYEFTIECEIISIYKKDVKRN